MTERLFTLIKLRNAERALRADKKNLPSIPKGSDDEGVVGAGALGVYLGHVPRVQENLNECKR